MRNLENIDLDTLDHVTGGCGGGQAQAQQQPPPVEQQQGNATTLVGFPVRTDSPKTMNDYATPSIIALSGYAPPADDSDTSTVQSQTSGDDDVQSGHGRFGMGFGHASAASDDSAEADSADTETASTASYGTWDQMAGSFGYAVGYTGVDDGGTTSNTTSSTTANDSPYLTPNNTGFTYATQSSAALDDDPADAPAPGDETGAMVCGVTQGGPGIMAGGCYGDDGVDGADGADGTTDSVADTTLLDNRTMLGSFHTAVDRGATASMMYSSDLAAAEPAAEAQSMGYSIDTDLGGFGHLQVGNGDVNVDVDTPLGNVHLGYANGQLGASINRG